MQVSPTDCCWVSASHFYSTDVIEIDDRNNFDSDDNDSTYKNLSKMRSYLKRCESAISSISLSGKRTTATQQKTNNSIRTKRSTSSWYIEKIDRPGTESNNEHFSELNSMENEMSSVQTMEQSMHSLPESQTNHHMNDECFNGHIPENDSMKPKTTCHAAVSMTLNVEKRGKKNHFQNVCSEMEISVVLFSRIQGDLFNFNVYLWSISKSYRCCCRVYTNRERLAFFPSFSNKKIDINR